MNVAMIAKVGWRLLQDHTSLWARVIRSKYKIGVVSERHWMLPKSHWSSTWRSIMVGLRDVLKLGQGWIIGDGSDIRFWTDKWVSDKPLLNLEALVPPGNYEGVTARDLWQDGVGWLWDRIVPFVSENSRLELMSVVVDTVTGTKDQLSWRPSPSGKFSVKSAYALVTRNDAPRVNMEEFFRRIWKVEEPERVRFFLWLAGTQSVMTNLERKRRHLCESDICTICKGGIETLIHILRDCPAMQGIWNRVVPVRRQREFFESSILTWLYGNLGEHGLVEGTPWSTTFAMAVWWG
ncbi:unnamed protein product [Microthlaspi erraticum]|uniref:Reverse transcriptase zinc-binding domain-containing protein n=1 Tax=Microthlaspi erraticum TaxID=1685480 RepID=A0A6D2HPX1_9BRAS|nr:unnamed protein product [Microthlaspi erraticum]